ncbi:MAG TPA: C-GCAxxG-C-C family protein [Anaeromyxobacteraceae bacterium]|nr:C-GCAxxG-C-C family protein [Anaeromyxobacteraceae bacterium]
MAERGFHCAQAVLRRSAGPGEARPETLDAASAFLGGTALAGMTCGALTGGLLLLGQRLGAIEDSRLRVLRQVATMAVRGDAFADERNAFNRAMNRGHDLARWFAGRFGSTQCRELTGCDFATLEGVKRHVEGGAAARCEAMAEEVAEEVEGIAGREASAREPGERTRSEAPRRRRRAGPRAARGQREI